MFENFAEQLYDNIILNDRYVLYLVGLGRTLLIAAFAVVLGVVIGSVVAIIKVYAQSNRKLWPLNAICDIYITLIRGTPVTVQLLITYYVIFASGNGFYIAVIAFGMNSGAYVAEIVRAGIMSVDKGQSEAGRSLGLSQNSTMGLIVLPQAIKNILPAMANEFIVLFKETAIVGYVSIQDLTKFADLIRSRTFSNVPLFVAALLYLIVVMIMTAGMRALERRLRKGDSR